MSDKEICCQTLRTRARSPFEVVMLGWYDGVTSAMARCRTCGRPYHVEMVAWDDEHEVRIYGFREVSRQSYERVIAAQELAASYPKEVQERVDAIALCVRDALATSLERVLYVAAVNLANEVLGAQLLAFSSWSELLGLKLEAVE